MKPTVYKQQNRQKPKNERQTKRQEKKQKKRQTKEEPRATSVENTVSLPRERERRGKSREERAARQREERDREREERYREKREKEPKKRERREIHNRLRPDKMNTSKITSILLFFYIAIQIQKILSQSNVTLALDCDNITIEETLDLKDLYPAEWEISNETRETFFYRTTKSFRTRNHKIWGNIPREVLTTLADTLEKDQIAMAEMFLGRQGEGVFIVRLREKIFFAHCDQILVEERPTDKCYKEKRVTDLEDETKVYFMDETRKTLLKESSQTRCPKEGKEEKEEIREIIKKSQIMRMTDGIIDFTNFKGQIYYHTNRLFERDTDDNEERRERLSEIREMIEEFQHENPPNNSTTCRSLLSVLAEMKRPGNLFIIIYILSQTLTTLIIIMLACMNNRSILQATALSLPIVKGILMYLILETAMRDRNEPEGNPRKQQKLEISKLEQRVEETSQENQSTDINPKERKQTDPKSEDETASKRRRTADPHETLEMTEPLIAVDGTMRYHVGGR